MLANRVALGSLAAGIVGVRRLTRAEGSVAGLLWPTFYRNTFVSVVKVSGGSVMRGEISVMAMSYSSYSS